MLNGVALGAILQQHIQSHVGTITPTAVDNDGNLIPKTIGEIQGSANQLLANIASSIVTHIQSTGDVYAVQIQPGIVISGASPSGPVSGATTAPGLQLGLGKIQ